MGEIEKEIMSQNDENSDIQQEQEAGDEMETCEFFVPGLFSGVKLSFG